jgi:transcriptional regulator with XRE-family HTH domain
MDLEDFDLVKEIDAGAAGHVYLARPRIEIPGLDPTSDYAIKVYVPEILQEPGQRDRIRREYSTGAILRHQNLVKFFHVDVESAQPFLVMEWVDGKTLKTWRQENPKSSPEDLLRLVTQLLEVVEYLHSTRRVHRDIKPTNLMITGERLKLLDYGVVRPFRADSLTANDEGKKFLGTIRYAAPELLAGGRDADYSSELYSIGAVLYFLLYGSEVYAAAGNASDLIAQKLGHDPVFPQFDGCDTEVQGALWKLTKKLLAREPGARPASALACLNELAGGLPDWIPFRTYFASALTRLDPDAAAHIEQCGRIIQESGAAHQYRVYLPMDHTSPQGAPQLTGTEVYWVDRERVASADLFVLLADVPSFGAGQEAEIACNAGVPILLVTKQDVPVSRMLKGAPGRILGEVVYSDYADLERRVGKFFGEKRRLVQLIRQDRERSYNIRVGRRIANLRQTLELTRQQLAERSEVPLEIVDSLETRPEAQTSISMIHLRRIAGALQVSPAELLRDQSSEEQQFEGLYNESVKNLREYALRRKVLYEHYAALKAAARQALRMALRPDAKAAYGATRALDADWFRDVHSRIVKEDDLLPLFSTDADEDTHS